MRAAGTASRKNQAAQPSAHDDEVVVFTGFFRAVPAGAVSLLMGNLVGSLVAPRMPVRTGGYTFAGTFAFDHRQARLPLIATATPPTKSRRVIGRLIPRSRSVISLVSLNLHPRTGVAL
jgi:hypothetical protein